MRYFSGLICNCLSYFTTAKISFTSILYPQFTHMIFIIYTSHHEYKNVLTLTFVTSQKLDDMCAANVSKCCI